MQGRLIETGTYLVVGVEKGCVLHLVLTSLNAPVLTHIEMACVVAQPVEVPGATQSAVH